ncbi:MAG: hypothetical protein HY659_06265 [Rhizobiales bacterium]|nr:hypothetical protein [Hyphomicrobiales bacterium]
MKKATAIAAVLLAAVLSSSITQGQDQKKDTKPAPAIGTPSPAKTAAESASEIAEKAAYKKAAETKDPKQRAAAFEAFIGKYPDSKGKISALQQIVAAHGEAGDHAKVEEAGERLLGLDPDNIRVMALVAVQKRNRAYRGEDTELLGRRVRELGEKGLALLPAWLKPTGIDDNQFQRLRAELSTIFTDSVAFGAFAAKDYKTARDNYLKTFSQHPDNFFETYYLGVASLEMTPLDPKGFWYVAKALNIASTLKNTKAVAAILAYGKGRYEAFKGNDDGWDQIVAAAVKQKQPPGDFLANIKKK